MLAVLVYLLYSVHASFDAEEKCGVLEKGRDLGAAEDGSLTV